MPAQVRTPSAPWTTRPRWVVSRAVRSVRPVRTHRVLIRGAQRFDDCTTLYSVGFFNELRPWSRRSDHALVEAQQTAVYAATRWLGLAGERGGRPDLGLDIELVDDPETSCPSTGLVRALSLVDVLTPGNLTGGLRVAATGTINLSGTIGPVSGVGRRAVAAHRMLMDLFLVPRGLRAEAVRSLPQWSKLRVVEVATLDATINKLVAMGGARPELPRPVSLR